MFKKNKTEIVEEETPNHIQQEIAQEELDEIESEEYRESTKELDPSQVLNHLKDFSKILPRLDYKREHSEKRIHQTEQKISEVEDLIMKLEEKKANMKNEIEQTQRDISKIDEIRHILQRVAGEKADSLISMSEA